MGNGVQGIVDMVHQLDSDWCARGSGEQQWRQWDVERIRALAFQSLRLVTEGGVRREERNKLPGLT